VYEVFGELFCAEHPERTNAGSNNTTIAIAWYGVTLEARVVITSVPRFHGGKATVQ
jgi:hypothetical protein